MNRRAVLSAGLVALLAPATAYAGGGTKKAKTGSGTTLLFPTLTATILRPDGRRGVLTVEVIVDAPDEAVRARAEQSRPLLRDAWNTILTREGSALRPGAPPDPERLARELQRACDRVLGRPGARVLLGSVIVN